MRKVSAAAILLSLSITAPALADDLAYEHHNIGLGFHTMRAPLGVRWWFGGQQVALDAGIGFDVDHENITVGGETTDESFTSFALDVGVPILVKSWDRVHFLVRPGLGYLSEETVVDINDDGDLVKESDTTLLITGELEFEVFLAQNFSVSAAHGIAIERFDPADPPDAEDEDEATTDFRTIGGEFTRVGFHAYLFGGGGH